MAVSARRFDGLFVVIVTMVNIAFAVHGVHLLERSSSPPRNLEGLVIACCVMAVLSILAVVGTRRGWNRRLVIGLTYVPALWALYLCLMVLTVNGLLAE